MTQKHTPTPWFVATDDAHDCPAHENSGLALIDTGRTSDFTIARLCEWHNAAFIIRACNAHDQLVEALFDICRILETTDESKELEDDPVYMIAKAALTAAEGE